MIPWASREALLEKIRHVDTAESIRDAFQGVGASTAVKLSRDDEANLVELLNSWSTEVSVAKLPEGIWDLRDALVADLARG